MLGDAAFDERDLGVEVVDLAQAAIDGFALVGGQLELGQRFCPMKCVWSW